MVEAHLVARGVPLTTITMVVILIAFKYDVWLDLLEQNSIKFGISKTGLVLTVSLVILLIMATGVVVWKGCEDYLASREKQAENEKFYEKEREALIALYKSLNGDKWVKNTNWCSNEPLNLWKGVKLDPDTKRVNKLILPENNLTGIIPEDIGDLECLIEIDFRRNEIEGKLPKSMVTLKRLQGLYLFENRLEGKIPDELSDLPDLLGIYLFNNNFEDSRRSAELFKEKFPPEKGFYVFI